MDPTNSFGGIAVCFSGGGCDFVFFGGVWVFCCTNGLDFLFFLLILRLMMGWDRSCA